MKTKINLKTKTIATLIALSLLTTQNLYSMERGGNDDLNTCVDDYRSHINTTLNKSKNIVDIFNSVGVPITAMALLSLIAPDERRGSNPGISLSFTVLGLGSVTAAQIYKSKKKNATKDYQKIIEFVESSRNYLETNDPSQEVKLRYFLEDFGLSKFISDHDLTLMDVAETLVRIDQSGVICREEKPADIKKLVNDFLKPNLNY